MKKTWKSGKPCLGLLIPPRTSFPQYIILRIEEINNKGNLTDERPPLLPVIVGTGLGSGFWPWGPGTAGSVLATLIWTAMAYWGGISGTLCGTDLQSVTFFLVIFSTITGTWATAQLQPYWGEDPSRVVIDEMAGVWIPLSLLVPFTSNGTPGDSWWWAVIALVLFRFFDMVKPLGIKKLDRKEGAFYVMADDLLGGIYAAITMIIIKIAWAIF